MTKFFLISLSIILVIVGFFYGPKIIRLYNLSNLYNEEKIADNFINIDKIFLPKVINDSKGYYDYQNGDA